MDLVDEIFAEYVISFRAGESDPRPFMARAEGRDREELVLLIDAFLSRAPGREWDPEAFRDSPAERLIDPLTNSLFGKAGTWPVLLPGLRHKARIKREVLVERLAAGLGVAKSTEKVHDYYHGMEQGTLDSAGVSDQVLSVLGKILGSGAESLRQAGTVVASAKMSHQHEVFARLAPDSVKRIETEDFDHSDGQASPPMNYKSEMTPDSEVDRLFTGGG